MIAFLLGGAVATFVLAWALDENCPLGGLIVGTLAWPLTLVIVAGFRVLDIRDSRRHYEKLMREARERLAAQSSQQV